MTPLRATLLAIVVLIGSQVSAQEPSDIRQDRPDVAVGQTQEANEGSDDVGHTELMDELNALGDSLTAILKDQESWGNPVVLGPVIVGLFSAAIGIGLAFATQRSNQKLQQQDRMERHLLDSLKWFEGGTQKRSIGVSVVEANWGTHERLRPTWRAVLVSQAVYLLAETKETRSQHEIENCGRVRRLLALEQKKLSAGQKSAIHTALAAREQHAAGGLELPVDELAHWESIAK